jgi:predicted metal-dependent hydrolase
VAAKRSSILDEWYRQQLKEEMLPLLEQWQKTLGVETKRVIVQRMKTKWGSCTPQTQIIRLNLELAKKPAECLEYIIVHELLHLIEPTHNSYFIELMEQYMPKWKFYREELNRLPVRHEKWSY